MRWLGAVQAQDYHGAKWALALRTRGVDSAALDRAFDAGAFLRTHVMRPTWHFVAPEDLRWLLALTGPRVHAVNAHPYRAFELDAPLFRRAHALLTRALRGGRSLTRLELATALEAGGIAARGQRLAYIVMHAEIDALVCSGPMRGKQHTYMLLEERVPPAPALARDEALATLARRYFTSHGPATAHDFAWWSGLTVADAREGVALAGRRARAASRSTGRRTGRPRPRHRSQRVKSDRPPAAQLRRARRRLPGSRPHARSGGGRRPARPNRRSARRAPRRARRARRRRMAADAGEDLGRGEREPVDRAPPARAGGFAPRRRRLRPIPRRTGHADGGLTRRRRCGSSRREIALRS